MLKIYKHFLPINKLFTYLTILLQSINWRWLIQYVLQKNARIKATLPRTVSDNIIIVNLSKDDKYFPMDGMICKLQLWKKDGLQNPCTICMYVFSTEMCLRSLFAQASWSNKIRMSGVRVAICKEKVKYRKVSVILKSRT